MIKEKSIYILIKELDSYKGLIQTGDEAFEIVEQKLKQLLKKKGD